MKLVFIGAGSFRTLPILRGILAEPRIVADGEVCLVDLNLARAEVVGKLLQQTPEYAQHPCRITWTNKLDQALPGADLVSLSMPVGSWPVCAQSEQVSRDHGFHGSDQLSLSGSVRALTGGVILLDVARRMEKHCPQAWLVDFANPVAIYSGMINNHTKIRCLGICGGFNNHRWDLPRLFGKDEFCRDIDVDVAGVNHLSFILRGTYRGEDVYRALAKRLKAGFKPPALHTTPIMKYHIRFSLKRLIELFERTGHVIFSTEGDGMMHLYRSEMMARDAAQLAKVPRGTPARWRATAKAHSARRLALDAEFRGYLERDLDAAFWAGTGKTHGWFAPAAHDLTVTIARALAGVSREKIVTSRLAAGAVAGFTPRTVVEYSMEIDKDGVHPTPNLAVPPCFQGLMSALATHQTLVGDAIATQDPKLLADAFFAYPLDQNTPTARKLWKALLKVHAAEIPAVFQQTAQYC